MFSRFTEKAIQAIMLAQEEAKRFHHSYVGTEHILLGIIGLFIPPVGLINGLIFILTGDSLEQFF